MCFGPKMTKYGNSAPGSPKLRFLRFLSFIRMRLTNMLLTSPHLMSCDNFEASYSSVHKISFWTHCGLLSYNHMLVYQVGLSYENFSTLVSLQY